MLRHLLVKLTNRISFWLVVILLVSVTSGWAASYKVLFNFNRTSVGPSSGLVLDSQGNAYGTTLGGGHNGGGSVYELSPTTGYQLLYPFGISGPNGRNPQGNLMFDSAGNLYGTTVNGGVSNDYCAAPYNTCGVVFKLSPPSSGTGIWTETVLYSFCSQPNCADGSNPQSGVVIDSQGNLYGTTYIGGCLSFNCGVVFKLSPPPGGSGAWTETTLYNFCSQANCADGKAPYGGLVFDAAGNLYGTTYSGGTTLSGTIFELSPNSQGVTWTETVLYNFCTQPSCADGFFPMAGVTFDASGNLYGTTSEGGVIQACSSVGCGVVFELMPGNDGAWTETILHAFTGRDGDAPYAPVVLDSSNNVYGTTRFGGDDGGGCGEDYCGTVFKLTPQTNGQWNASVFRFPDEAYGASPMSPVVLDSAGNVYGTTYLGGTGKGGGVVFRITQ